MLYTILVANNVLTVNFSGDILSIPIENITSKRYKDQQKLVNILYNDGGANTKILVLDYTESTSPVFATYNDFKAWIAANVIETLDVSQLTDTTGVIPTDVDDLSDNTAIISHASAGTPLNAVKAYATLEFDGSGTSVQAGDTVTINGKVYTYVAVLTAAPGVEGEVLIGADDTSAMANLYMAINNIGISYGLTHWCTVHPTAEFKEYSGANGMTVQAKVGGIAGNLLEVSTDIANAEWQNDGGVLTTTLVGGMNGTIGKVGDRYFPPADPTHFWVAIADNGLTDANWVYTDVRYVNCIIDTYGGIQASKLAGTLETLKYYLVIDHQTSYNIFDGGTMVIIEEKLGTLEPLILLATSPTTFDKVAMSPLFPNDIIHYSLNIQDIRDIGYGNGVDTVNANFKGQIYYRKDTVQNNECGYDFRNVKFRRYAVDATKYDDGAAYVAKDVCKSVVDGKIYKCITATTGEGDPTVNTADWVLWWDITADAYISWTADTSLFNIGDITTTNLIIDDTDYECLLTFGDWYKWVHDFTIGLNSVSFNVEDGGLLTTLNNLVFKTKDDYYICFGNSIECNSYNGTFLDYFYRNRIGFGFTKNVMFKDLTNNIINDYFTTNISNNSILLNSFNDTVSNCLISSPMQNNLFSQIVNRCIFRNGNATYNNIIYCNLTDIDFSNATLVYASYNKTIYQDATLGVRLSYISNNVLTFAAVTD